MMVIAIGLSSYNIALFHLVNHAFYKGLLFLGAGAVIHAVGDNQDFRRYGGLISYLPLTYSVMLIASLSLVAFPFMTGFYSKDFILESAFGQYSFSSIAVYIIAVIGAIFTTLYSVKVLYLTFLSNPNGPKKFYFENSFIIPGKTIIHDQKAHEGDVFLSLPLVILAIFSIFFGYLTKDIFIGLGSGFFSDNSIFIHPLHEIMLDTEFSVPVLYKLLPLIFTISFTILALLVSEFVPELLTKFKFSTLGYNIFGFFNQRFLVEMYYNKYITNLVLNLGGQTTKVLDRGSIELLGPYGFEIGFVRLSKNIAFLSTGVVTSYALYILTGFVLYLSVFYYGITAKLGAFFIFLLFSFFVFFSLKPLNLIKGYRLNNLNSNIFILTFINMNKIKNFLIWTFVIILIVKNLFYILDFFIEPCHLASNDDNWKNNFLNRKINIEHLMLENNKEQLKNIKLEIEELNSKASLTEEEVRLRQTLEQEKLSLERSIKGVIKDKVNITKDKLNTNTGQSQSGSSSTNEASGSGTKRSGEDNFSDVVKK
jgi:NADH-ubiquinone oxidoreductase chain 5